MAVLFAIDDDFVGAIEELGISVCCRERKQHPIAFLHRAATDLDILSNQACHRDGCVGAKHFFDCEWHQVGLGGKALEIFGIVGEVPQCRANGRPRGVDASDEDEQHGAANVFVHQFVAIEFGLEQERGEIVAWVGHVIGDLIVEVRIERLSFDQTFVVILGDGDAFLKDEVDHVSKVIGIFGWEAEHLGDDAQRNVLGVLDSGIDNVFAFERIEQVVAELASEWLERVDLAGSERGQQQTTRHCMERRIRCDGGSNTDRRWEVHWPWAHFADDNGTRGEVLGVVGNGRDVLVRYGQPRAAVAIAVRDGAGGAQFVPDGERVADPGWVGVIEVGGEIGDGRVTIDCHWITR